MTKKKRPSGKGKTAGARSPAKDEVKPNRGDAKSKAPLDGGDYHNLPALADYIARVGAEPRNFRRFVVKLEAREHYHYDAVIIRISKEGTIECSDEEHAPTKEEKKAIEAELARATFPKSIAASESNVWDLKKLIRETKDREPKELYEFPDASGGITFVQERIRKDDGSKIDLPWSYWGSETGWLNMEPDGDLPLFGLDRLKKDKFRLRIFLHEGAATAAAVQKLVDSGKWKEHPWGEELNFSGFSVHLGWPGGAPNPHRVDWTPIKELSLHAQVIMVCDHDPAGEDAASSVSHAIQRRMSIIRFGAEFDRGFDLADSFPETLFKEHKGHRKYIGPTFDECLEPATWATRADGKLRAEFVEEWWYTVKPAKFINQHHVLRNYDMEEFNAAVAAFAHKHVPNIAAALRRHLSAKTETVDYDPGRESGRITVEGMQVVNLFRPTDIRPAKGSAEPFLDFIKYLVPAESDQNHLLKWIATLIARPDIRMTYGLLLWSITQGVGKTTLAEQILMPLVGRHNYSCPSAQEAAESNFTGWIAFKRLAVIAEIYEGHTAKTYNRLKTIITDENVRVNEKYEKPYGIKNFIHIFATSNSSRALKLDDFDRRWFVPGIIESKRPTEYFTGFRSWLQDGGLTFIANWAREYVAEHGPVLAGEHAPLSDAKVQTIEDSRSEGELLIAELGDILIDDQKEGKNIVLRLDHVREWLAGRKARLDRRRFGEDGHLKLESAEKISGILRARELRLPTKRFKIGKYDRFRIVANFPVDNTTEWTDISKHERPVAEIFPL